MNIETLREHCLSKPGATEGLPFGPSVIVFKAIKMFALVPLDVETTTIALKCDPDWAEELREKHPQIAGAYHMNKKHWNQVDCEGLSDAFVRQLIDHSYDLVVASLSKKERALLDASIA